MATTDQTAAAINTVSSGIAAAASQLGANVSADDIAAIAQFAIDALNGAAWRAAAAAGKVSADAVNTEDAAEAEQRES